MELQQKVSNETLSKKIGEVFEVLIEDISFDKKYYIGRTSQDVPEIDGLVYIENSDKIKNEKINQFVKCEIIGVSEYDLIAKIIK